MKKLDLDALKLCVSIYRKSSSSREMEVRRLLVQNGWRATALHCCRLVQQASLKLPSIALTPSELKPERLGDLSEIWLVDPTGRDPHRTEMAMLLKRMTYNGVSRYSPRPVQECEAAEERRRELRMADNPTGDAA